MRKTAKCPVCDDFAPGGECVNQSRWWHEIMVKHHDRLAWFEKTFPAGSKWLPVEWLPNGSGLPWRLVGCGFRKLIAVYRREEAEINHDIITIPGRREK